MNIHTKTVLWRKLECTRCFISHFFEFVTLPVPGCYF